MYNALQRDGRTPARPSPKINERQHEAYDGNSIEPFSYFSGGINCKNGRKFWGKNLLPLLVGIDIVVD
jgi:hypothetical protein